MDQNLTNNEIKSDSVVPTATDNANTPIKSVEPEKTVNQRAEALPSDSKGKPVNISSGSGINLIPRMSEQEVEVIVKKNKFNFSGAAFLIVFVVITILILAVNILFKQRLNEANKALNALETKYASSSFVVKSNEEILDRIDLLESVQTSSYSPKAVFEYWDSTVTQFGTLQSINLTSELEFKIEGSSKDLSDVSKLWHLLSIDPRVEEINLESVSTPTNAAGVVSGSTQYSFEGKLSYEYFVANSEIDSNN